MKTLFKCQVHKAILYTADGHDETKYVVEADIAAGIPAERQLRMSSTIAELVEELFAHPYPHGILWHDGGSEKKLGAIFEYHFLETTYVHRENGFLPSLCVPLNETERLQFFETYGSKLKPSRVSES